MSNSISPFRTKQWQIITWRCDISDISNTLIDLRLKIVRVRLQLSTSWLVPFEIISFCMLSFHSKSICCRVHWLCNGLLGWLMLHDVFWQLCLPQRKRNQQLHLLGSCEWTWGCEHECHRDASGTSNWLIINQKSLFFFIIVCVINKLGKENQSIVICLFSLGLWSIIANSPNVEWKCFLRCYSCCCG